MANKSKISPIKRNSRLEYLIGGLFIIGMILIFVITTLQTIEDYITRDSWMQTTATVVKINSKTHWLTYEYTVDDERYIGTRLTITEDSKSDLNIPEKADTYPEGEVLTIYYNPKNPSRSAISPIGDFSGLVLRIIAIFAVVILYFIGKRLLNRYLQFVGGMLSGNIWKGSEPKDN